MITKKLKIIMLLLSLVCISCNKEGDYLDAKEASKKELADPEKPGTYFKGIKQIDIGRMDVNQEIIILVLLLFHNLKFRLIKSLFSLMTLLKSPILRISYLRYWSI